tara:strand:- start:94 stop:969 length:876 start_codon:yes stop_codon:yes gene_type:complete
MDSTDFSTFTDDGVELTDTLSDWRLKTNGIVVEVDAVKSTAATLATTVATSAVNNNSLVLEKIEQIPNLTVLGNTSGSTASVSEISVLDQDTLSSNSATALATQQSIKAYVDSIKFSKSYRHILANADLANGHSGFATSTTILNTAGTQYDDKGIFDSDSSSAPSDLDWDDILPMTFSADVEKTIIRAKYNWDNQEEITYADIVIDWENGKIYGSANTSYEHELALYLPKTDIASAATDYSFQTYIATLFSPVLLIGITGSSRTITKMPWLSLTSYTPDAAQYVIENHIRG